MWDLHLYDYTLLSLRWKELGEWEPWMHYALESGGKRVRPFLAWKAYAFYAGEAASWEEALPLLHAIELLHNFTLVHDDVMDRSPLRRGRLTLYQKTNENTAILIGDALLIAVYERLSYLPASVQPSITRIICEGALEVCQGQLSDLALAARPTAGVSMEEYEAMILQKTGALMGTALAVGGLLGGASSEEISLLKQIGRKIGRLFQLQDDYLDAFGEDTGKERGCDIAEGKKTFLWLWAYAEATPEEQSQLDSYCLPPEARREIGLALYERLGLRQRGASFLLAAYQELLHMLSPLSIAPHLLPFVHNLYHRRR
ncbi:MAG: polyprenyl synthetase family protein [Bacteroidia bacterium]|nr:polyprenyl synthetase family protein [Bacteroidia bacterium]MDW8236051.1 polyprenyl synthetase family protein [Bacteroidia bacterium]